MSSSLWSPSAAKSSDHALEAPFPNLFTAMTRFAWARSRSDDLARTLEALPDSSPLTVRIRRSVEGEIGMAGQAESDAAEGLDAELGKIATADEVRSAMIFAGELRALPNGVDIEADVLRRVGEAWARRLGG